MVYSYYQGLVPRFGFSFFSAFSTSQVRIVPTDTIGNLLTIASDWDTEELGGEGSGGF